MKSLKEEGFTFDCGGSHIIFSKDKTAMNFMLSVLGKNKIRNRRNTRVLYHDCYVKYPFENDLASLSKIENFECLYDFIKNTIEKEKGQLKSPENLEEWFYYSFGKSITKKYLIPYNEKIWKYSAAKTNLNWVERIPQPPIEDIVKSSLGIETEGYTHQLNFYYPRTGGIESVVRELRTRIADNITINFNVSKITKENSNWIISNGKLSRRYNTIISTIPVPELIQAMDAPVEVRRAAQELKHNSLISLMIGLDKPKLNNLSWLYIPDKDILPHRVSFPSNFSPYVAPEGKSSILAEITCKFGSRLWKMSDKAVKNRVIDDLSTLKILNRDDICFTKVKRFKYAYVINDLEYENNIKVVKSFAKASGIKLLGRFAEFEYLNMDACIRHVIDYVQGGSSNKEPLIS